MRARFINRIVACAGEQLGTIFDLAPAVGAVGALPELVTTSQVNVVCMLRGQLNGHVVFGMPVRTADRLASALLGIPVITFDNSAATVIADLAWRICSPAALDVIEQGCSCIVETPTIVRGASVALSPEAVTLSIPLDLGEHGEIDILVSLQWEDCIAA